jgi:hypothetical protein
MKIRKIKKIIKIQGRSVSSRWLIRLKIPKTWRFLTKNYFLTYWDFIKQQSFGRSSNVSLRLIKRWSISTCGSDHSANRLSVMIQFLRKTQSPKYCYIYCISSRKLSTTTIYKWNYISHCNSWMISITFFIKK